MAAMMNDDEVTRVLKALMQNVTHDVSIQVQTYLRQFIDEGIYSKPSSKFYDRTHDFWESIVIEPNDEGTGFEIFADPDLLPSKPSTVPGKLGSRMEGNSSTYQGIPISELIFGWLESATSPSGKPGAVEMFKQTVAEMDANFNRIVVEAFAKYGVSVSKGQESGMNVDDPTLPF